MTPEDCQEIFAHLSEFLDGELEPESCARMEAHIRDCAPCIEFIRSLEKSVELCRRLKESDRPGSLEPAVRDRLREVWRTRCTPSPGDSGH